MNNIIASNNSHLKDPSCYQVKIRKTHQSHEFVVPSSFATIPTNSVQTRIMKNAHYMNKRLSLPPSIREENEEDEKMQGIVTPVVIVDDDEEDIPLAILAYRKGFIVPDKAENVFPLIQHIPTYQTHHQPYFHHQKRPNYYRYSDPCITSSYMFNHSIFNTPNDYHHQRHYNTTTTNIKINSHRNSKDNNLMTPFYQLKQNYSYSSSSSNSSLPSSEVTTAPSSPTTTSRQPAVSEAKFYRRQSSHI